MAEANFWILAVLVVLSLFSIGRWIGRAEDSIMEKLADLESQLEDVRSKLGT